MGASFQTMILPASLSDEEIKSKFRDVQDQDRYENGHSYSGGFGMAKGLRLEPRTFDNPDDAWKYLEDHCQKWDEAKAVRARQPDSVTNPIIWCIGAWCAS